MSDKIKILLVEDDPKTTLRMEALIYSIGYELIPSVDNSEDAIKSINEKKLDVLVMDIDIKGSLDGIQVVELIKGNEIPVIFVTGFDDDKHYQRAKKSQPVAYLIKPFNKLTFQAALENAILNLSKKEKPETDQSDWSGEVWLKDCFFVKRNNLLYKIKIDDIQFIQSEGNYCHIISMKKHPVKISLTQILKKLPPKRFVRIHQRFVIQANLIDNIDTYNNQVYLGGKGLPIGPKYRDNVLNIASRL